MSISSRATKAQIIEYAQGLQAQVEAGPTWPQVLSKLALAAGTVATEFRLAVLDTYRAGAAARRWCDTVWMELSRPILK